MFLKIFASHTHAFCSYFSMLGGIYAKTGLFFSKLCFFWNFNWLRLFFNQSKLTHNFWVSLCLFWSIEPKVRSIENRVGCFFINSFLDGSNTFSKSFLPFLSPYDSVKENLHFFCCFRFVFLQGFPLSKPVSLFYPSFCILFHVFMHKFMHFIGIFRTFKIGVFDDSNHFFWNWSLGFVSISYKHDLWCLIWLILCFV